MRNVAPFPPYAPYAGLRSSRRRVPRGRTAQTLQVHTSRLSHWAARAHRAHRAVGSAPRAGSGTTRLSSNGRIPSRALLPSPRAHLVGQEEHATASACGPRPTARPRRRPRCAVGTRSVSTRVARRTPMGADSWLRLSQLHPVVPRLARSGVQRPRWMSTHAAAGDRARGAWRRLAVVKASPRKRSPDPRCDDRGGLAKNWIRKAAAPWGQGRCRNNMR